MRLGVNPQKEKMMTKDQKRALDIAHKILVLLAAARHSMEFGRGDLRLIAKALDRMADPKPTVAPKRTKSKQPFRRTAIV